MLYKPKTAVWEITMGCNMRCKHCGSACADPLPDELTTKEALLLCDDLGELGFEWITLSGGEPTIRPDWHLLAQRLKQNGIEPNIITNGWNFDRDMLNQAFAAGVNTLALSLDGLEETHDYIRKKGSYQRVLRALELMRREGRCSGVVTTINKLNIAQLPLLKEILAEREVKSWQLQIGLPMGNMAACDNMLLEPCLINEIIDFAHQTVQESEISVILADCIGYYDIKTNAVMSERIQGRYGWRGCPAGKYSLGILHNGDITGCASMRDKNFIEGNVRVASVKEIWENPANFSWNRKMSKELLDGFCGKCRFGRHCLGGCSNVRLTTGGGIGAENKYCSYNLAMSKIKEQFDGIGDIDELVTKGKKFADKGFFQLSEMLIARAVDGGCKNIGLLNLYGYVSFMLDNYRTAKEAVEKALALRPEDAYALKGLGLSLCRMDQLERGVSLLKKSIALADRGFMDPYYDLAVILMENDRKAEALAVLEEGRAKSPGFIEQSRELYDRLTYCDS